MSLRSMAATCCLCGIWGYVTLVGPCSQLCPVCSCCIGLSYMLAAVPCTCCMPHLALLMLSVSHLCLCMLCRFPGTAATTCPCQSLCCRWPDTAGVSGMIMFRNAATTCHCLFPYLRWSDTADVSGNLDTCFLTRMITAAATCVQQEREEELAAQAHSCREYAKVNAIAMRKVLKSHDQLLGSSTGHQLLQVRHTQ